MNAFLGPFLSCHNVEPRKDFVNRSCRGICAARNVDSDVGVNFLFFLGAAERGSTTAWRLLFHSEIGPFWLYFCCRSNDVFAESVSLYQILGTGRSDLLVCCVPFSVVLIGSCPGGEAPVRGGYDHNGLMFEQAVSSFTPILLFLAVFSLLMFFYSLWF
jgi:hypothetical protein